MAEGLVEQFQAKVAAELASIVGDGGSTYWYTPDSVRRAEFNDAVKWQTTAEVFHEVRQGQVGLEARTSRQLHTVRVETFITAARRDKRHNRDDSVVTTIKNRLASDVKRKLAEWPTWSGLSLQLLEPTDEEHEVEVEGWAAVHLRFTAEIVERYRGAA